MSARKNLPKQNKSLLLKTNFLTTEKDTVEENNFQR